MGTQTNSNGLSGPIWGAILVVGGLGLLALLALIASMYGMNVPGFPS